MVGQRSAKPGRRIVAIVLPELLCELAARGRKVPASRPLGVVLVDSSEQAAALSPTAVLAAVNARAQGLGMVAGQTLAEQWHE